MAIPVTDEYGLVTSYLDPAPIANANAARTSSSFFSGLRDFTRAATDPVEDVSRAVSIATIAGAIAIVAIVIAVIYVARKF